MPNSTLLVLPKPSRFDKANNEVLSGPARRLVDETIKDYDVCYADEFKQRQAGYKYVILTGQESLDQFAPLKTLSSSRGFVYHIGDQKLVATYWPQDAVDHKDYESYSDDYDDANASSTGKDDAPTSRANYRFWFQRDCAKLYDTPEALEKHEYLLTHNVYAADELTYVHDKILYFDLESNPDTNTITCFSYALDNGPVRTVLIYDYNGRLVPGAVEVMAGLARAFRHNTVVIHNAFFDCLFLAMYHGVPCPHKVEDTMLIQHRLFPEAEKSLAHAITLWLNEPYHKGDGGTWNPRNFEQQDRLLRYNAKDVVTLRAVHNAQWRYIRESGDAGLRDSVLQVNASIYPYLYTSFHGFLVNIPRLIEYRSERTRRATQLGRIINILVGYEINPGSPMQVADYFVTRLGYDILSRTDTGNPRVDETALWRYLSKYRNPVIQVMLAWKRASKVAGELGFKFWRPLKGRS